MNEPSENKKIFEKIDVMYLYITNFCHERYVNIKQKTSINKNEKKYQRLGFGQLIYKRLTSYSFCFVSGAENMFVTIRMSQRTKKRLLDAKVILTSNLKVYWNMTNVHLSACWLCQCLHF